MLQLFKTLGCTIPDPAISTQPEYLHTLHPLPLQIRQETSTSALGSVKGKNEGRNLILISLPYISLAKERWFGSNLQNQHSYQCKVPQPGGKSNAPLQK